MRFSRSAAAGLLAGLCTSLALGASITCPGGAGAYPYGNAVSVTITVSTTIHKCIVPSEGNPKLGQAVCSGGGSKCLEIEAKVKRIIDGAECTQTITDKCDAYRGEIEFDCFGRHFKASVSSSWGDVVANGDCSKISALSCN